MDAKELNILVELTCGNPQWEHIKFSFEDSLEEVRNFYMTSGVGYPSGVWDNLSQDILVLKAQLVSSLVTLG